MPYATSRLSESDVMELYKDKSKMINGALPDINIAYMETKDKLSEADQDEIEYRLCNMKIPQSIIPFIYENKYNILNNDIKIYVFKILINTIYIGNYNYWGDLIEKNLISQLVKLQEFLFTINNI